MKSLRFFLLLAIIFCSRYFALSQGNNCHLRISLLTCAPGQELYSTFGHTALRITDSVLHYDVVFNYGTFDFNDPDFYLHFVQGKLNFSLSEETFANFMEDYQYEQRSVWEQELNFDCEKKMQLLAALNKNVLPQNRFYKYDFLLDNCTSRVRDLLGNAMPAGSIQKKVVADGVTSRQLIHSYLDAGGEPWSRLGIDILLGSKLDKPISNRQAMFLPDYLMKGIDSAVLPENIPAALHKNLILNIPSPVAATGNYWPFVIILLICCVVLLVYMLPHTKARTISLYLDSFFLYLTGLMGLLLLFMWFGTEHTVCKNNFNLLWALPTNLIAAFLIWRNPRWLRTYFYIAFIIYALLLAGWFWLPQDINVAIAPVVAVLLYRYAILAKRVRS